MGRVQPVALRTEKVALGGDGGTTLSSPSIESAMPESVFPTAATASAPAEELGSLLDVCVATTFGLI